MTRPLDTSKWAYTVEDSAAQLNQQICPVCGEGPWKSVLNHASRKHGIDAFTMRDTCGLSTNDKVIDAALSKRLSDNNKGRDMTHVNEAGKNRRKPRRTKAGKERNILSLQTWEQQNPELARQARAAAGKAGTAVRWSRDK